MGKIVITTNSTLDGIVQDPDGLEGFSRGGWFAQFGGADLADWTELETAETLGAEALLLGRRSEQWFADRWTSRSGTWADKLNSMPKYVVSATLEQPAWTNATVLRGDLVKEVTALKQAVDGEILVFASYRLGRALLDNDLVDEVRLVVFPVVLGAGTRLFGETGAAKPLQLEESRPLGRNLTFLRFRPQRNA